MAYSIETRGLTRHFGKIRAVEDVSLQVPSGSVFGFLGPNGSGKTTTLRMLLGLVKPDTGSVLMNGHDLSAARGAALASVGAIIEQPALYPHITGHQTLKMAAALLGRGRRDIDEMLEVAGLTAAARRKVKGYSLGMKQRLAIARALLGRPSLLLLDEPTNGLDPSGIAEMRELVRSLPARFGTTVLLSSHLLSEVEQMADTVGLIKKGSLIFQGTLDSLKEGAASLLILEATDMAALTSALATRRLSPEDAKGKVQVLFEGGQADRAALLAALIAEGHAISHFELRPPGLESLFLQLTGEGDAS